MGGGFPSAGNRCFFLTFNEVGRTYQIQKKGGYTRFPFKRKHVVKKLRCRLPSRIIEITRAETAMKIGYLKDFYDTVIHIPVNPIIN